MKIRTIIIFFIPFSNQRETAPNVESGKEENEDYYNGDNNVLRKKKKNSLEVSQWKGGAFVKEVLCDNRCAE